MNAKAETKTISRFRVGTQKVHLGLGIKFIVVEASSWRSAGMKAYRANKYVTSVTRIKCGCDWSCDCE